jgi:mRNA-degrading endonuclease HigB of HigAB toxin-antitoxin module
LLVRLHVRIINPKVFGVAARRFPKHRKAIEALRESLQSISPRNSSELKRLLPSLERYPGRSNCYRLDVGGRRGLRMICVLQIAGQRVYVYLLGSHKEYDEFSYGD